MAGITWDPDPDVEPERSPRGTIVKKVGEVGGLVDENGEYTFRFKVAEIETDVDCGPYAGEPVNGQYVALHIEAETTEL